MARRLRIAVAFSTVPFTTGGAELHARGLVENLRASGVDVEMISIPFKWYPSEEIVRSALVWRLLDLSESDGRKIDAVIATRFPSYLVRHPNKVVWLMHQYRQAYDLYGTKYCELDSTPLGKRVRRTVLHMDNVALREAKAVFANSANVARRLKHFNGMDSEPLYHPPPLADRLRFLEYGDFALSVGRLDPLKRHDLFIRALALLPGKKGVIAGSGAEEKKLKSLADELGIADRVYFSGSVDDVELIDLYSRAAFVYYAPMDEDYGYVTHEAFLSLKPVVCCSDSGGVLEFVSHGSTGLVAEPSPRSVADAMNRLFSDKDLCRFLGERGFSVSKAISWDNVVNKLLSAAGL